MLYKIFHDFSPIQPTDLFTHPNLEQEATTSRFLFLELKQKYADAFSHAVLSPIGTLSSMMLSMLQPLCWLGYGKVKVGFDYGKVKVRFGYISILYFFTQKVVISS